MDAKHYTTKQMGDAGEMLVAAELTLAGIPALTVPGMWPDYDVIAQPRSPRETPPQRVSVKTRTFAKSGNFVGYDEVAILRLARNRNSSHAKFWSPHLYRAAHCCR